MNGRSGGVRAGVGLLVFVVLKWGVPYLIGDTVSSQVVDHQLEAACLTDAQDSKEGIAATVESQGLKLSAEQTTRVSESFCSCTTPPLKAALSALADKGLSESEMATQITAYIESKDSHDTESRCLASALESSNLRMPAAAVNSAAHN